MEIGVSTLLELGNALEMNGRQFILRDKKIQEMKSTETYSCPHGQDLIYFHIKSSMIKALIQTAYNVISSTDERLKAIYTEHFEYEYNNYKQYYTHSEFLDAMDEKYKANA